MKRQFDILCQRAREGDHWAQDRLLELGIHYLKLSDIQCAYRVDIAGNSAYHCPLNLLIDTVHHPLAFSFGDELFCFSDKILDQSADPEKYREWFICSYYHTACRLDQLAQRLGFQYTSFDLTYSSRYWGCCYCEEKRIVINQNLLFQSPIIMDSVLIHELCHLSHPHHQDAFWKLYNHCMSEIGYKIFRHGRTTARELNKKHVIKNRSTIIITGLDLLLNATCCKLYDRLSADQRKCLPLQKIPL